MEEKSHLFSPRLSEREYHQFAIQHRRLNRYSDVLPCNNLEIFDGLDAHSRVKLKRDPDYINASHLNLHGWRHLNGHFDGLRYIAAQAPVHAAMADWWEMIWQEGVRVLVVLVGNDQRGKVNLQLIISGINTGRMKELGALAPCEWSCWEKRCLLMVSLSSALSS